MDQEDPTSDPYDDVVIFVAEGLLCEQFDVSVNDAVVALAGMAVDRGIGLLELAREVVAGALATGSFSEAHQRVQEHRPEPDS
jgi:hypothetical protein